MLHNLQVLDYFKAFALFKNPNEIQDTELSIYLFSPKSIFQKHLFNQTV